MTTHNPIEVARETLKQLSMRKLLPTPENFEQVYRELTQTPYDDNKLAATLLRSLKALAPNTPQTTNTLAKLKLAFDENNGEQASQLVLELVRDHDSLTQNWGGLIHSLLSNWELRIPNLSQQHKRTSLERVLINYSKQPTELNQKLLALMQNWNQSSQPTDNASPTSVIGAQENKNSTPTNLSAQWEKWQNILSLTLKHGLKPHLLGSPAHLSSLEMLQVELEQVNDEAALNDYLSRLHRFMLQQELHFQQEGRLVTGLTNMLHLLLENIAELNRSDDYLRGQVSSLQEVLNEQPLSMQQIYAMEASLKEVIRTQGILKASLDEATNSLQILLDRFISGLALMTDSTGDFQNKIKAHSEQIQQSHNIEELGATIASLIEDTSLMQVDLAQSKAEFLSTKEQVEVAEKRIVELETALEAASAKVLEDHLTGALNRRGLGEQFQREISRAERSESPLSITLIDIDNFKQLNDRYGHLAGDDALKYLVNAIKNHLRPADIVARFGGEEFVILMPDTPEEEAAATIQRLQRELTKTFFLADNNRLVITFSAGVTQWRPGEQESDVLERADHSMYQAKINGKNQVHLAPPALTLPQAAAEHISPQTE
ncbi:diguanylate cyclase [Neisseriaceae bacterium TC5R-5]|nr:diguanylate cyclase [Neisseriaceae bacterium TC5R-5]